MLVIKKSWIKTGAVIIVAVIITSVGIKASDLVFNSNGKTLGVSEGCEAGMVFVSTAEGGFCIDTYEAAPGKNCGYSDPKNQVETRNNLDFNDCLPVSEPGLIPWRNISQDQAALACAKTGKRLPSQHEWFLAALGTPDKDGNWNSDDCQVASNWPSQPGPTGNASKCISPAGAYDMIGNVWEWVAGTVEEGKIDNKEIPPAGYITGTDGNGMPATTDQNNPDPNYYNDYIWSKTQGIRAIARGGFWDNKSDAGQYSLYMETPPSFAGIGIGFRCVK
jgi:formylglycine-generating enzyme required for sulfatase activity